MHDGFYNYGPYGYYLQITFLKSSLNNTFDIDMGINANALSATKVGQGADSLITTENISR